MRYVGWFIVLYLWIISGPPCIGQQAVLHTTLENVESYLLSSQGVQVPMSFGKSDTGADIPALTARFTRIDSLWICYSDFPKGRNFDQLNQQRLAALVLAGLPTPPLVRYIRQTDCQNEQEARQLFHGLILFGLPASSSRFLSIPAEQLKLRFEQFTRRRLGEGLGKDSTMFRVVERGKVLQRASVIVADWTASMYPFTLQLLLLQMQEKISIPIEGFVFFNDGDKKSSSEKRIGKTGGLYATPSRPIPQMMRLMGEIKKKGDGGELQENDVEALLYAEKMFPNATELTLIADSFSAIRDFSLAPQVTKPVRIVLARTLINGVFKLNQQYVQLALLTGGSLHTDDADYVTPEALRALLDPQGFQGEQ